MVSKLKEYFPLIREREDLLATIQSDMLLRQYKRVRSLNGEGFSYNQIKNVYLIVIYEKSPKEFKKFPKDYYHYGKQVFDTGLQLNML